MNRKPIHGVFSSLTKTVISIHPTVFINIPFVSIKVTGLDFSKVRREYGLTR